MTFLESQVKLEVEKKAEVELNLLASFLPPNHHLPQAMNYLHSHSLPSVLHENPAYNPPRTFLAITLIPSFLLFVAGMGMLSPPSSLHLYILTVLLCIPFDHLSIKMICRPSEWEQSWACWWLCFGCQFPVVLFAGDYLLHGWMVDLGVSRGVKIPTVILMLAFSFLALLGGMVGELAAAVNDQEERRRREACRTIKLVLFFVSYAPLILRSSTSSFLFARWQECSNVTRLERRRKGCL